MHSPIASRSALRRRDTSCSASARSSALRAHHSRCAALAWRTAASISSAVASARRPITSSVAGSITSTHAPALRDQAPSM